MKISPQDIEQRIERFKNAVRDSGVKLTPQRLEIFREVAQTEKHPDAEIVFRGVRERIPTVSLDTVYRTLWLLDDLGLIKTLGSPQKRTRFDANLNPHHHFVCRICGLTQDFYSNEFNELKLPEAVHVLGHVETTQVEVCGICNDCTLKAKNKSNNLKK